MPEKHATEPHLAVQIRYPFAHEHEAMWFMAHSVEVITTGPYVSPLGPKAICRAMRTSNDGILRE